MFPNSVSYNIFVTSALQKTEVPGCFSTSLKENSAYPASFWLLLLDTTASQQWATTPDEIATQMLFPFWGRVYALDPWLTGDGSLKFENRSTDIKSLVIKSAIEILHFHAFIFLVCFLLLVSFCFVLWFLQHFHLKTQLLALPALCRSQAEGSSKLWNSKTILFSADALVMVLLCYNRAREVGVSSRKINLQLFSLFLTRSTRISGEGEWQPCRFWDQIPVPALETLCPTPILPPTPHLKTAFPSPFLPGPGGPSSLGASSYCSE